MPQVECFPSLVLYSPFLHPGAFAALLLLLPAFSSGPNGWRCLGAYYTMRLYNSSTSISYSGAEMHGEVILPADRVNLASQVQHPAGVSIACFKFFSCTFTRVVAHVRLQEWWPMCHTGCRVLYVYVLFAVCLVVPHH